MKKAIAAVFVALFALTVPAASPASAKIAPASCENGGGQEPAGQQPVCKGGGLTQEPATNPAGHAPAGQQP
jgi:hypothetical protein